MSNIAKNDPCNYGFYAQMEGLAADVDEKDCNQHGTKYFESFMFCEEHYPLVKSKK